MNRLTKQKRGQFVIIAVLMIAIMVISIGALMHRAVTYYKHEPWEEYLTLIGNIELSAKKIVELSLVNFTNSISPDPNILKENIEKWQKDLSSIYTGYGISVKYSNDTITTVWNETKSFSTANATFTLNITSIGLSGYKFNAKTSLKLMQVSKLSLTTVKDSSKLTRYICTINVTVTDENNNPITNLRKENFVISGLNYTSLSVSRSLNETYGVIYMIKCELPQSSEDIQMIITVYDPRGIKVTGSTSGMLQQIIETKSPTSTSGQWNNPTYAYADDSNYASANKDRDTQQYGGYGFAIPNGSTIMSVRVGLDVWTEEDEEIVLYVSKDGGAGWINSWSSGKLPNSEATFWVDATSWTNWSTESINNNKIWTKIEHTKANKPSYIYLDWIRVEVAYIPP
jgi:hypothetical protein